MICGRAAVLHDCCAWLDSVGFEISPRIGGPGDYVVARIFVEEQDAAARCR